MRNACIIMVLAGGIQVLAGCALFAAKKVEDPKSITTEGGVEVNAEGGADKKTKSEPVNSFEGAYILVRAYWEGGRCLYKQPFDYTLRISSSNPSCQWKCAGKSKSDGLFVCLWKRQCLDDSHLEGDLYVDPSLWCGYPARNHHIVIRPSFPGREQPIPITIISHSCSKDWPKECRPLLISDAR